MKLEPLIKVEAGWTGITGRFGVHVFEGHLTLAQMDRMEQVGNTWFRENPGKLIELVVIYPSNSRMTTEERHKITGLMKRWQKDRVGSATVILGAGMIGAMHRSVLTALQMMAPPPHPAKVFSAVSDAVDWLVPLMRPLTGPRTTATEVLGAVEDFCAAFKAR
jgi:hypothetical protein